MVYLFAHRGGLDGGHQENSIEAFADALAAGAHLESDVRLSVDGVAVLVHDSYVWGAGLGPRRVRRLSAERLRRAGAITLEHLYRELGSDFELSLDLKDPEAGPGAVAVARRWGDVSRLWLVHDSLPVLQRISRTAPDVRLMHETRLADLARADITPQHHMDQLVRWGVDAQNTHWSHWNQNLLEAAHQRGLLAFGSIAQERHHMQSALSRGLDGLYTDHVRDLMAVAHELNLETTS